MAGAGKHAALFHVAALSSTDAWAVGAGGDPEFHDHTVAFHWDGQAWTRVRTPSPNNSTLQAVSANARNDVWAVGSTQGRGGTGFLTGPLVERWDGSRWRAQPLPVKALGLYDYVLLAVSASGPDDVWAMGEDFEGEGTTTGLPPAVIHWDGHAWSRADLPVRGSDFLFDISAGGSDDVWAVGSSDVNRPPYVETLTLHWDGRSWTRVRSPNPARHFNELRAVSGDANGGAWAVGDAGDRGRTLILHWDGAAWRTIESPRGGTFSILDAVSADAGDDAWAVGSGGVHARPMILHWDGSTWSRTPCPNPGFVDLEGVAATSPSDAFAVGSWATAPFDGHPLFLRWDGSEWKQI
jgi:hypothetical protein